MKKYIWIVFSAPHSIASLMLSITLVFCTIMLTACDYKSNQPPSVLADFKAQPLEQTRIILQPIKASLYPIKQWSVRAVAYYSPVDNSQPNATETTTSRKNCIRQRYSLNINLSPCTRTFDRSLERVLSSQQISVDAQALHLDYFFEVQDQQADFRIESLAVIIKECPECQEQSHHLKMSCWAEEVATENVQTSFNGQTLLVRYQPAIPTLKSTETCGLRKEDYVGSFTRESVLKVLRGQFHEGDYVSRYNLLHTFPAIPTKSGGWMANKANKAEDYSDFCPLAAGESYDSSQFNVLMDKTQGWQFLPEVEVNVYKSPGGNVCGIWLDGYGEFKGYTPRVRYFFTFSKGQLVLLKTEEPDSVSRTWRYDGGEPFEYSRSQDDSVAGDEEILYWHRDAAAEWPERMDYMPDFTEFANQQAFAAYLLRAYSSPQPVIQ